MALPRGGTIGVAAPSGPVEAEALAAGCQRLEALGYRLVMAANIDCSSGFTAGTVSERLDGLLELHFDRSVDALVMARGGAGAIELLDRFPWEEITASPKPWMGFSDFSLLASAALKHGMPTIHGPMVVGLEETDEQDWRAVLEGRGYPRKWDFSAEQVWRAGAAVGHVVAGCLVPLTAIIGTPFEPPLEGAVLFWEEVQEAPYRLSRLLTTWRLTGRLKPLKGIVIGALSGCAGPGGSGVAELRETILSAVGVLEIPIVAGLPFGHEGVNRAMAIGMPVSLDTGSGQVVFERPGVE